MATAETINPGILEPASISALVRIESMTPEMIFLPGTIDPLLDAIKAEIRSQKPDLTTEKGRKAIASLAYKVARTKTFIDEGRQKLVADEKKRLAAIDAEGRRIREELDSLRDEVRRPLTEWEETEKARITAHRQALADLEGCETLPALHSTADVEAALNRAASIYEGRDWEECTQQAIAIWQRIGVNLRVFLETAKRREAEAAELEQLRQEKADREEREQREREAREAKEREERLAREQAEKEERAAKEREEAIRRATAEAEERARKAEEARIEAEQQAERDRVTRHKLSVERLRAFGNPMNYETASAAAIEQRIATVREMERDWEEFTLEAGETKVEVLATLESALSAARERERIAAEQQAEAERQRIAQQERERLEADRRALEERQRKLEADKQHRSKIHNAIITALMADAGLDLDQARAVVFQIYRGNIPHVSITY